jgi:HEAT repeat protein
VVETRQARLIPAVQKLLTDQFVPVRFAAVLAVADLQYEFGKASVENLLRDPDPNVKLAASYAMVKFGMNEYAAVLRKAIASSNQTVRANAALLLGKLGNQDDLELLLQTLTDKSADDKVNYQAAESIARMGYERIYPRLWAMLISAYADVRVMGVLSMGMLKTDEAKEALVGMLTDEVLDVRVAAAGRLGALGDNIGEAVVLAAFEEGLLDRLDKRGHERAAMLIASAIGQIGTPPLKNYLPKLLQDESKLVRIAAGGAVLQCVPGQN